MSVMDNQQFVVGKDIDFEFAAPSNLQDPSAAVERDTGSVTAPSGKKKRKKKKKKSAAKAQVRVHSDGQGLTINNIDATMESELFQAATLAAKTLAGPLSKPDTESQDRLELVAKSASQGLFWTLSPDQEEQVRQFWANLPQIERRWLLRSDIERRDVLRIDRKISEIRDLTDDICPCTVCGQSRSENVTSREGEMERIYNEYTAALEKVEEKFLNGTIHDEQENETPRPASDAPLTPEMIDAHLQNSPLLMNFQSDHSMDHYDEEDIREEAELLAEMTATRRKQKGNRLNGGILSVADDLLRNDGKRFVDVMEQIAECKIVREISRAVRHDAEVSHLDRRVYEDSEFEEDDELEEDDLDEEGYDRTHDQLDGEEHTDSLVHHSHHVHNAGDTDGKILLQNYAMRTFEHCVLLAFRVHVAKQRQMSLLAELEAEEARVREEKEQKKIKEREKRKDKKKAQQKLREEERLRKEQERKAKEEAQRAKEEAQRLARIEEQRLKQEAHRLQIEERLKKLALEEEKARLETAEKERSEQERLEKERLEKERLEKEHLEKERLEKERLEKERLEKERLEKERLENERLENESLLAKVEQERLIQQQTLVNEQYQADLRNADISLRKASPSDLDWTARTDDELRGWSPLNGIYPANPSRPPVIPGATVPGKWSAWPLESSPAIQPSTLSAAPVATNARPHGGSLWSNQSIWSATSLDGVQNAALSSYDELVSKGAAVDGYIPAQILFQATAQAMGNPRLSQSDFYSACGVATGTGPFYGLRDSVGLITHLCRK